MSKLTSADAMKYLPDAKVKFANQIYEVSKIYFYDGSFLICNDSGVCKAVPISDCKLILRSIESLKDEEKEYVKSCFFYYPYEACQDWNNINYLLTNIKIVSVIKFIDYLRSISVDIDGFEKQGVAVYE